MGLTPPSRGTPDLDAEAQRRVVRRAMRIGIWVWPSFTLLDAWMCFVAYPGAPFGLFLIYRLVVGLAFLTVYRDAARPGVPVDRLAYGQDLCFGASALGIALMAVHLGGIRSPYMHGISVVALVRAAVVPEAWRRSLHSYVRIGLAFPLVMGLGAVLSPLARAEWLTGAALTGFANNYVFVLASAFLGMVTGHTVWSAQQQVYRARRLGRYRLQAPIGKGGMGEVWLAWDPVLRRNVALKLLRLPPYAGPAALRRFEREAHATSQLQGPHTVRIFDFGASDDGIWYIAMEYLTGSNLGDLVAEGGPLPPDTAIDLMTQACVSLEEAHAAGIIHRDIKPENLVLCPAGNGRGLLKLLDFGIAQFREPETGEQRLTRTGIVAGTPAYMAPERWQGGPADERSDIYSLGLTFCFVLTGRTPPGGWAGEEICTALPEALRAVILRCLARRPEDRYQSAGELRQALEALSACTAIEA
ncbi:MAG TPA: serine/threonine-protein kinase [Gemmatimonadales bacterium]|nr:serine/threonine-protein kinase [Gemmatimonadales bacterium]